MSSASQSLNKKYTYAKNKNAKYKVIKYKYYYVKTENGVSSKYVYYTNKITTT